MSKKKIIIYVVIVVIVLALIWVAIHFWQSNTSSSKGNNSLSSSTENKVVNATTTSPDIIIQKVSRLIEVPSDEVPTIATVVDPQRLKDQPFFSRAQVGDKVLIYEKAQKVILYDPVNDRIREETTLTSNTTNTNAKLLK